MKDGHFLESIQDEQTFKDVDDRKAKEKRIEIKKQIKDLIEQK